MVFRARGLILMILDREGCVGGKNAVAFALRLMKSMKNVSRWSIARISQYIPTLWKVASSREVEAP